MKNYQFTSDWFSAAGGRYWEVFVSYLHNKFGQGLIVADVGSYEGRSAIWMIENLISSGGEIHIVDSIRGEVAERLFHNIKESGIEQERVLLHAGDSVIKLPKLLETHAEKFHFIFIDAGKSAADNLLNALIAERLLAVGGVLVIDDYSWAKAHMDPRVSPKLGINLFSSVTLLMAENETPRTQASFVKIKDNNSLFHTNIRSIRSYDSSP